jgi:hypothetical protein
MREEQFLPKPVLLPLVIPAQAGIPVSGQDELKSTRLRDKDDLWACLGFNKTGNVASCGQSLNR